MEEDLQKIEKVLLIRKELKGHLVDSAPDED
jgi:hypothetical protein